MADTIDTTLRGHPACWPRDPKCRHIRDGVVDGRGGYVRRDHNHPAAPSDSHSSVLTMGLLLPVNIPKSLSDNAYLLNPL